MNDQDGVLTGDEFDALAATFLTPKMIGDLRRLPEGLPHMPLEDIQRHGLEVLDGLRDIRGQLDQEAALGDQADPRVIAHAMGAEFFLRQVCGRLADELARRQASLAGWMH